MTFKFLKKTPLAWNQLMKEKTRLLVAIAGIGFADILIFFQLGLMDALYDGATQAHYLLNADLVVTGSKYKSLSSLQAFPKDRLYQTLENNSVRAVSSIYIDTGTLKSPNSRLNKGILVLGVEPDALSFKLPAIQQHEQQLKMLDRILFDEGLSLQYGSIAHQLKTQEVVEIELNTQLVEGVGLFRLGASFTSDGDIITSDSTFLKLFPDRSSNRVDLGLVHLQPKADLKLVQEQLRAQLGDDFKVLTVSELRDAEKYYWESQGAIGFIFGLGSIVGLIVGIVIVYQILYTDVANHLPEYATLKAMGYSDRYLLTVLLQESLILAILGFIPGLLVSFGLYQITFAATLMPVMMKIERAMMVLILTIVMCTVSGAIAMQKLQLADPADVF
jgi:putative ABC transport system permease protein